MPVMPPRIVSAKATDRVMASRLKNSRVAAPRRGVATNVYTRVTFRSGYAAPATHSSRFVTRISTGPAPAGGAGGGGGGTWWCQGLSPVGGGGGGAGTGGVGGNASGLSGWCIRDVPRDTA